MSKTYKGKLASRPRVNKKNKTIRFKLKSSSHFLYACGQDYSQICIDAMFSILKNAYSSKTSIIAMAYKLEDVDKIHFVGIPSRAWPSRLAVTIPTPGSSLPNPFENKVWSVGVTVTEDNKTSPLLQTNLQVPQETGYYFETETGPTAPKDAAKWAEILAKAYVNNKCVSIRYVPGTGYSNFKIKDVTYC